VPDVPAVPLNTGAAMPQIGFGVWRVPSDETERAVTTALEAGYRSIDTAALYGNEAGVGAAVRASGLPRDEVFVTTKLWNTDQGRDKAPAAFERSMDELGLETVDLYLVHWPTPGRDLYVETWRVLEQIASSGRARAIGVSNFTPAHLQRLAAETYVVPAVNQVELHPWLQQAELREHCAREGIVVEAWSPLGQGGDLLQEPVVQRLAKTHGVSPAQVVLRWHVQLGGVAIPKSVTPERVRANLDVFGFGLSEPEMTELAELDRGQRLGLDPDRFNGG
jgi:2,5-diketo-D-gluconate reductase A